MNGLDRWNNTISKKPCEDEVNNALHKPGTLQKNTSYRYKPCRSTHRSTNRTFVPAQNGVPEKLAERACEP